MKIKYGIGCQHCGEKFESPKAFDVHRPIDSTKCLTPRELLEFGWRKNRNSGAWIMPKAVKSKHPL